MGPNTHVERIISDYEPAIRIAAHQVWPNAILQGCAVHFQRAIAHWAYINGAYRHNTDLCIVTAVRRAFALCYLPPDYTAMGIQVIEEDIGTTPFGQKFVQYLLYWLNQEISVYGQPERTTNGCETFRWRIQRHHDRLNNNINQFISQLRDIESRCSTSIRQFTKCVL